MAFGKHVVCGIPMWLFGTTENWRWWENQRDQRLQILKTEDERVSNPRMAPISCGNSFPNSEEEHGIQDVAYMAYSLWSQ